MRSAIIDIGRNAIRAVVYENDKLGAPEIFNSKFKSDILNLLSSESIEKKHQTYLSIQYLLHIFKKLDVNNIKCVATEVLRNHERANDFIKYIKDKYNFSIDVISGKDEAYLTALGLVYGIEDAKGIAADLGGGSLELVEINNNNIGKLESLALGTKTIDVENIGDKNVIEDIIRKKYGTKTYNNLYFIGGSLRFMARIYIDFVQYPLKNLHNLEISTKDFSNYLDKLQSRSVGDLYHKRINANAILVAQAMISVFNPEKIIISTYGLKEGVRISNMSKEEQKKDIIFEKVQYLCTFDTEKINFDDYFNIVNPLLSQTKNYKKIMQLSMMLYSVQHNLDKTLPPKAISEFILSLEIPFSHPMRIMLALVISYATNYKPSNELLILSKKLITKEEHNNCQIIGYFLYIAEIIDGSVFSSPSFDIIRKNHYLEISVIEILPRSIFEKICNRLKSIAFAKKMNSN